MSADLVAWLGAQLDEDERAARATFDPDFPRQGDWSAPRDPTIGHSMVFDGYRNGVGGIFGPSAMAEFVAAWNPARVLAEIEAKRAILDRVRQAGEEYGWEYLPDWADFTTRVMSQPFRDREGFRGGWRMA